jgi:RNA 3'-terminal phosphate cyclase-like protein
MYSEVKKQESESLFAQPFFSTPLTVNLFRSPGFALSLVSSSTTDALQCAETVSLPGRTPEDVALEASYSLLTEIATKGCVPRSHQSLLLMLMALGPQDVGNARLGALTPQSIATLRDLRDFLGVTFKVKVERTQTLKHEDDDDAVSASVVDETLVSCIGAAVRGARKVG